MNEQDNFEALVKILAKASYEDDYEVKDEIHLYEDKIEETGLGEAYFGVAQSDYWCGIEFARPCCLRNGVKFCAEYYDGNQAPFTVCEWKADFKQLEALLKEVSPTLYTMYEEKLAEVDHE